MGSKNISIPEDVCEKLREERRADESLGETIDRLLGRQQLSEFWGACEENTATRAREAIETSRERNTDRLERLYD
jgi:predicted CopG family antitoxin